MKTRLRSLPRFAVLPILFAALTPLSLFGMGKGGEGTKQVTITLAAAASLKNAFDTKLIPLFEARFPAINVQGTYDASGKLQTQIENGLPADIFFSASTKQMNALVSGGYVNQADVIMLLQNKLVLIKKKGGVTKVSGFNNITDAASIALGDPGSVPAGQYAKEAFIKLKCWNAVEAKRPSFGTNVTEVLSWVAAGSAEVGVVYGTDAASNPNVELIAQLQDGVLDAPIIYPVALTARSEQRREASRFIEFLCSPEGIAVFKTFGFAENNRTESKK